MTTANLSVTDNGTVVQYTSAGETEFTFPWLIRSVTEINVTVNAAVQYQGTDYTVDPAAVDSESGGKITFSTATTAGEIITIWLATSKARTTGFAPGAAVIMPTALNDEFIALVRSVQQLDRDDGRALRLPIDDTVADTDMQLPYATARAGKYLRFADPSGAPELAELSETMTELTRSELGKLLYPVTLEETAAGVTPSDDAWPPLDVRRYGAVGDGVTDDRAAFVDAIKVLIQYGRGEVFVPDEFHCVIGSPLPELSMRSGYSGGFSAPVLGPVSFRFGRSGTARITYTGTGTMMQVQCDPVTGTTEIANFSVHGGHFTNGETGTAAACFKIRDGVRCQMHIGSFLDWRAGYGILLQNWYEFSENITVTGIQGGNLAFRNVLYHVGFQDAEASAAYEGEANTSTFESFARFNGYNWFCSGSDVPNWRVIKVEGRVYDSVIRDVKGNAPTATTQVLGEILDDMDRTMLIGWKFEGSTADTDVMFDFTGYSPLAADIPRIVDCTWTNGGGETSSGLATTVGANAFGATHTPWAFDAAFAWKAVLQETLTADVTNWEPAAGFFSYTIFDLDTDGSDYSINSIGPDAAPGWFTGYVIVLRNIGLNDITLVNGGAGLNANKLLLGQDLILAPFSSIMLTYDETAVSDQGRWRPMAFFNADLYGTSAYTVSGYTDRRAIAADASSLTVSGTYTQSEVEAIRDELDELQEAYCTLVADLKAKLVLS
jgi:hypothetical protein